MTLVDDGSKELAGKNSNSDVVDDTNMFNEEATTLLGDAGEIDHAY